MANKEKSQWVVRLPDRMVKLTRPISSMRVFSTAEVLQFKTYYGGNTSDTKSRIEQQQDANSRQTDVQFEYWVLVFALGLPVDVLCCTVQRVTEDRILDALHLAMFTNCGDNTYVDFRDLLAADKVPPEQIASATATGRFVDLGDGGSIGTIRREAVADTVETVDIPVQTIPTRRVPAALEGVGAAGSWRRIRGDTAAALYAAQTPMATFWTPAAAQSPPAVDSSLPAQMISSIPRGAAAAEGVTAMQWPARYQSQMRQLPTNRNTLGVDLLSEDATEVREIPDTAEPPRTLEERDARRRANPMFGLDES